MVASTLLRLVNFAAKMAVFCVVVPCCLVEVLYVWQTFTDVSEVLAASIIRAMSDRPDNRGSKHL
jgi:hypothetical protein